MISIYTLVTFDQVSTEYHSQSSYIFLILYYSLLIFPLLKKGQPVQCFEIRNDLIIHFVSHLFLQVKAFPSKELLARGGHHGHDRTVVGFTTTYMQSVPITIKVVSLNPANGEVYSIHYVIKFVSDLQQFSGFLQVLWFPPSIKQTATIELKYC